MTAAFVLEQATQLQPVHAVDPYYNAGYFIGVFLFFLVLVLIYRFAGRWGWFGILVRMACAGLVAFRIFSLLAANHAFA
jgi:hypothetical protein